MMELLQSRYGTDFMTALHRDDANGLAGLQEVLDARTKHTQGHGPGRRPRLEPEVALDGLVDGGVPPRGGESRRATSRVKTLDATVNWDNPQAYSSPGAPSNGADYVRLRDAAGATSPARHRLALVQRVEDASDEPVQWTVDPNPPRAGDAALYSGFGELP